MKIVIIFITIALFCIASTSATAKPKIHHHVAKHSEEGGHGKKGEKQNSQKHITTAKKSHHVHEVASKGESDVTLRKVEDKSGGGKKSKSHSQNSHQSSKHAAGHSGHGAKYEDGSKHKKTGVEKGFREKYHKDEYKKHDSFYSNGHKTGDYHVFGGKNSKHLNQKSEKKSNGKHFNQNSGNKYGKSGKKASGHKAEEDRNYKHEGGHKVNYAKQDKWAKLQNKGHHNIQKYKYYPTEK